jgi:hypothetical protein
MVTREEAEADRQQAIQREPWNPAHRIPSWFAWLVHNFMPHWFATMMLIILPFVKSASVLLAFLYFAGAENSHKLRKTNPQCETPLVFETLTHPPLNKEPKIRFSITPPEGTGHIDSPMILAGEHVVVYFAGLFGSRLEHFESPDDRNRPFLITLDRPGSGCTAPWKELGPGNTQYTQVADVVLELLDDVNATSFEAVGWSSGGP